MNFFHSNKHENLFQVTLPPSAESLRQEVRDFLQSELDTGGFEPQCDAWLAGFSPEFSRKLGERGWLGMTWPREYGGQERSALDRFVVTEELLAASAPVVAHWIADRQTGPLLLRYGTEEQRQLIMPKIARGECYFAIGMSEPDSGSDLASIESSATKVEGGWRLNGHKIWTSWAHRFHYSIALFRTSPKNEQRHAGMSQFLVDLSAPGLTIKPIISIDGNHHFNQLLFDDVFVPDSMVVGTIGRGWQQVIGELAFERSGPERLLSSFPVLLAYMRRLSNGTGEKLTEHSAVTIGQLVARLWAMRRMSLAVAFMLDDGDIPDVEGSLVKDLGTRYEQDMAEIVRLLTPVQPSVDSDDPLEVYLAQTMLRGPSFTLRGGTNEILRGIVARNLGLR
ncbi:MAG: acyl-CoA dehydrogenase family protein [Chloroflexota bacterium]